MKISKAGCFNLITAYIKQIGIDYIDAMHKGNIKEMIEIEKHIRSEDFLGEAIGVSAKSTLSYLRDINERHLDYFHYKPEKYDYEIVRDKISGYPVEIIKKEKVLNGEG